MSNDFFKCDVEGCETPVSTQGHACLDCLSQISDLMRNTQTQKNGFYVSLEWRKLRYKVLIKHGKRCEACGQNSRTAQYHVDHIKPRSRYPELELDIDNLQVLCADCNIGKSDLDETDWRDK